MADFDEEWLNGIEEWLNGISVNEILDKLQESFGGRMEPPESLVGTIEGMFTLPHLRTRIDRTGELVRTDGPLPAGTIGGARQIIFGFGYADPLVIESTTKSISGFVPEPWIDRSVSFQTMKAESPIIVDRDGYFLLPRYGRGPYRIVAAGKDRTDASDWFTL